jgi:membrane protease YdiL (CAAX protease family)
MPHIETNNMLFDNTKLNSAISVGLFSFLFGIIISLFYFTISRKINISLSIPNYNEVWGIIYISSFCILLSIISSYLIKSNFPITNTNSIVASTSITAITIFALISILTWTPIEEIIFRGIIQNRLELDFGSGVAIFISGIIQSSFVIIGINGNTIGIILYLATFCLITMAFGYSYYKTNNLLVPILIRCIYLLAVLYLYYILNI